MTYLAVMVETRIGKGDSFEGNENERKEPLCRKSA